MATYKQLIDDTTNQIGAPEIAPIMYAIGKQESGGNIDSPVINKESGARGPFQVMPATARMYGFKGTDKELEDPATSAKYAALKMQADFRKYKNPDDVIAAFYQGDNGRNAKGGYRAPAWGQNPSTDDYVSQVKKRMEGGSSMADNIANSVAPPTPADADATRVGSDKDIQAFMDWYKNNDHNGPAIEKIFQDHLDSVNQEKNPVPDRPVPSSTPLGARLLSAFGGGLASNISHNPAYLQNSMDAINSRDQQHDYAVEANQRKNDAFLSDKEQRRRMLQDKLQELHLGQLLDAGDTEKALKLMNTQASIQSRYKADAEKRALATKTSLEQQKLKDWLTRDDNKEANRRVTLKQTADRVAAQTKMPEVARIALEKSLNAIEDEYKSRRDQASYMQGGGGLDDATFQKYQDERESKQQQIIDSYMKKYAPTDAEGKPQTQVPVFVTGNTSAPSDSTAAPDSAQVQPQGPPAPTAAVAAPAHVETPQEKVIRIARALQAAKGKK